MGWGYSIGEEIRGRGKKFTCRATDLGSIPGPGTSPAERNGYPFQYSGLENLMDREVWRVIGHGVTRIERD